jgi:hypothetical protein
LCIAQTGNERRITDTIRASDYNINVTN